MSIRDMSYYVNREPKMLKEVVENFSTTSTPLNDIDKRFKNIVIYATGSSMNAALSAKVFLSKILNCNVELKEPSFAQYYDLYLDSSTLYIAISQGGRSASIINLVKHLQTNGNTVFVISNEPKSPLGEIAEIFMHLGMEREEMPFVTVGQSGTIVYLWLIGIKLATTWNIISVEEQEKYEKEIIRHIELIPLCISKTDRWYEINKDNIINGERFLCVSYGASLGSAKEFETKFTETVRVPSSGFELEEFMHGPYIGIQAVDIAFFLEPNGILSKRQEALMGFLKNHIRNVYEINLGGEDASGSLNLLGKEQAVELNEYFTSILFNVPIHLISWYISQEKGIDLTKSSYPDFDSALQSKI